MLTARGSWWHGSQPTCRSSNPPLSSSSHRWGPAPAPHPPLMTPQHPPSPSLCPPPLQGLRSSTQAAGCVLSLYLLSPRLTALLLLVLPVLVGAGTALGSVLRALSRQAQEQVMGLGGGGTCRDPPPHPCGAQRCSATSPCWHRWPKPPGWPTRCWATCAQCAPSPWRSSRRGEDGGAAVGSSGSLPPQPTPPFSPPPSSMPPSPPSPHLCRLYCAEAERSSRMSQRLGLGIAAFQGLSNLALNGQQGGGAEHRRDVGPTEGAGPVGGLGPVGGHGLSGAKNYRGGVGIFLGWQNRLGGSRPIGGAERIGVGDPSEGVRSCWGVQDLKRG